jgi:hypothetical protein
MELILLLHISQYDANCGRFTSDSFKESSREYGGGISVVDRDCAVAKSDSICAHIRRFYSGITQEPPIFWFFDSSILRGSELENEPSTTGDLCHRNIRNFPRKEARRIFRAQDMFTFKICAPEGIRNLTSEDLQKCLDDWNRKRAQEN